MAKSTTSSRTASSDQRPRWRRWLWFLLAPALALVLVVGAILLVLFVRVPLPEDIAPVVSTVYDHNGNEVGSLTGDSTRSDVALDDLPEHVPQAVLAAEDRDFYAHGGVSPLGTLRALWVDVREGGIHQGGSTITQQYVKNAVVGTERTLWRKLKEAALAIKLDRSYDKRTILEWYLNTAYWGRGAQGIGAAARTYFGTTADQLTINQAATLAGMIQAPERLDPAENPDDADRRRRYVLDGMLDEGWITQSEHDQAVAAGLPDTSVDSAKASETAPYYIDAVRRELRDALGDGAVARGLRVHTALDMNVQRAAEQAVRQDLADSGLSADDLSAAVVSVDPSSGSVVALVGGPDYASQPFNVAVRGARQIGSTFKAFTLAAFIEAGYSPDSRFDAPAVIDVPDDPDGIADYAHKDRGTITVWDATALSANTVFVQLEQEVGPKQVADLAERLGLPSERNGTATFSLGSAMTLGVDAFTPLELAGAYNTLNAEGVHVTPHLITRVEDAGGNTVWEPDTAHTAVMDTNDALLTTEALRGVVEHGTGTRAALGRPVAGKTGTTQGGADGWFAGYTPELTTVTWVGRLDSNEPVDGLSGGHLPAQIWHDVMSQAMADVEATDFPDPTLDGYEVLNPAPVACPDGWHHPGEEPTESAAPTAASSDTPQPTTTETLPGTEDQPGGPCVREVTPSPSPSPSETSPSETSPSPTDSPSPSPTLPTLTTDPTQSPSPTASPSPSDSPAVTKNPAGTSSPAPSPSPTGTTTSSSSPSPTPT